MRTGWAGVLWYGTVIGLAGRLRHPGAAVSMDELRRGLDLHHHILGGALSRRVVGDAGLQRNPIRATVPNAVLDLMAWLDPEQVHLPKAVDRYPTPALNRELYFWLAAFLALDEPLDNERSWPLSVRHLLRGVATSFRVVQAFPALAERYGRLCAAELAQRSAVLPRWDASSKRPVLVLEAGIRHALGAAQPPRDAWLAEALDAVQRGVPIARPWPHRSNALLPFLPVALWSHPAGYVHGLRLAFFKRRTRRRAHGIPKTLAQPRFDPRHEPESSDGAPADGRFVYPEWAYQNRAYRTDWCAVFEQIPSGGDGGTRFHDASTALVSQVRKQFEALRQLSGWQRRLDNGEDLDLDAYVESIADARGCGRPSTGVYRSRTRRWRDLSVAVLVDSSRSTEAWVGERRVIGIARDAMLVLAEALAACADDFALFAFASDSRLRVACYRVKGFDEAYGDATRARMLALRPHHYTRMGAAIRHVGVRLGARSSAQRLLLVLTDGRPNDPSDGYEGRYGLEDTRRALLELRMRGMHCFGLTIDRQGREYLPDLFGPGHYAVLADPRALPQVLPRLYGRITGRAS